MAAFFIVDEIEHAHAARACRGYAFFFGQVVHLHLTVSVLPCVSLCLLVPREVHVNVKSGLPPPFLAKDEKEKSDPLVLRWA